ncbi:hypothetical protein EDB84DRAFT_768115 [Lactarius hengduanensis]|nr:hypothetical protein EDB84DRAFT_768115 [Lactarius hengduanensis]
MPNGPGVVLVEPCMIHTIEPDVLDHLHAHSTARAVSVALPAASGRGRGGRRSKYKYRTDSGGVCVARRTHVEGLLEYVVQPGDLFGVGAMELRDMHLVGLCDLRSVFEKSSQTSGAGEGTADGVDGRMPQRGYVDPAQEFFVPVGVLWVKTTIREQLELKIPDNTSVRVSSFKLQASSVDQRETDGMAQPRFG